MQIVINKKTHDRINLLKKLFDPNLYQVNVSDALDSEIADIHIGYMDGVQKEGEKIAQKMADHFKANVGLTKFENEMYFSKDFLIYIGNNVFKDGAAK